MGDSVLERNLCFIDTPGYGHKTSVGLFYVIWDLVLTFQSV
jgi:hypothetical protein